MLSNTSQPSVERLFISPSKAPDCPEGDTEGLLSHVLRIEPGLELRTQPGPDLILQPVAIPSNELVKRATVAFSSSCDEHAGWGLACHLSCHLDPSVDEWPKSNAKN